MTDSQKWLGLSLLVLSGWLLYLLAPILAPFMVAALFAYLGDPVVDRLEKLGLSRTLSVVIVFTLIFGVLLLVLVLLVPQIERQVVYLIKQMPVFIDTLQQRFIPWLAQQFGITDLTIDTGLIKKWIGEHWAEAGNFAQLLIGYLSKSGLALVGLLGAVVLVPVVTFYLLRDWDVLLQRIRELIPRHMEPKAVQLAQESNLVLGAFIRGQLLVMLALAMVYSVGLWIVGLKLALLVGLLAGLVSFVPYLGFIVGILVAGVAIFLQTHEAIDLLYVSIVFGIGQMLEGMVLTPALVGDRIGLHPVAVIFAVLAGGQLFGFIGVLLALPVAAVLVVLLRHAHAGYVASRVYDAANK